MSKYIKLFNVLLIAASIALSACSSSSSTNDPNNNGGGNDQGYYFEANVAGSVKRLEHGKDGYKMTVTDETIEENGSFFVVEHVNFSKYDGTGAVDNSAPIADLYFMGFFDAAPTAQDRDNMTTTDWDPLLEYANFETRTSGLQIEWRENGTSYGSDRKGQGKPNNDLATITYHKPAGSVAGLAGTYDTKGTFKALLFTGTDAGISTPLVMTNGKFSVRNSIH